IRSPVYLSPPRTSVTDSVGMSTRPIFSSRPKACTRDSSDSFTLRSNPEYEWMMYHFMLGLRGFSAIAAALSWAAGEPASVSLVFFCSSCIVETKPLPRKRPEEQIHASSDNIIDHEKIHTKEEHSHDHDRSCGLHLFAGRRSDLAHLCADVVVEKPDAVGDRLDLPAEAVVVCCGNCICHLLCSHSHHCT